MIRDQIHEALSLSDVSNDEFKSWIQEINNKFHIDNFTSNPSLFNEEDIKGMPILGNWSWQQFCMKLSKDFVDLKKDSLDNKVLNTDNNQRISALEHKIIELEETNKRLREEVTHSKYFSECTFIMMKKMAMDNGVTMPVFPENSRTSNTASSEQQPPATTTTSTTTTKTTTDSTHNQNVMIFDKIKPTVFGKNVHVKDMMYSWMYYNIDQSWENRKKFGNTEKTDQSNMSKGKAIVQLFKALIPEDVKKMFQPYH